MNSPAAPLILSVDDDEDILELVEIFLTGKGYRVITRGQSPTEMPNGRLVFFDDAPGISACKATGVRRLLFTIDRNGMNRKVVSANLTIDTTPQNNSQFFRANWKFYDGAITVSKFENRAGWHGQWDIGDAWGTVLTDMLNQSGKFIVLV